ncbi:hypothetical protein D3C85_1856150 [compost metagenome]
MHPALADEMITRKKAIKTQKRMWHENELYNAHYIENTKIELYTSHKPTTKGLFVWIWIND